jgi:transcriptional regulator with XRE-family HTH domain
MLSFEHLGRALRWLRDDRGQRQYEVAETAGITKAMLSAYETGRQKPSLETLEKLLQAMDSDLEQLNEALLLFETGRRPSPGARLRRGAMAGGPASPFPPGQEPYDPRPSSRSSLVAEGSLETDIRELLGLPDPLPPEQEAAVRQILDGFHRLLRYLVAQRLG